jgi:probable lipoprotein NlpC
MFLRKKLYSTALITLLLIVLYSCKTSQNKPLQTNKNTNVKSNLTDQQEELKKTAQSYIGTSYKYGGTTRAGMDCSGLTSVCYTELGITLPHSSTAQSKVGQRIYIGELQVGDLVFFGHSPKIEEISHVGIVVKIESNAIIFVHATTKGGVMENDMYTGYWRDRYICASRPLKK